MNKRGADGAYQGSDLQDGSITAKEILEGKYERSNYQPTDEEKAARSQVLRHFALGMVNMWTPRVELNDLAVIQRYQYDQGLWNTYQSNNGQPSAFDDIQGWRSNAMRPIVRNKCISIAAHATARLIFPRIFATNEADEDQQDAARVMEDLMEWAADKSDYRTYALRRVISALSDPASIGYTEYTENWRDVKVFDESAKGWHWEKVLDDKTIPCFNDVPVPVDELYIEDFYQNDIQKQGWLIWRRVIPYSLAEMKYRDKYPNFGEHVRPGVQTVYSDANQSFYFVYDPNMRMNEVEECIYWNKNADLKLILVNGVLLTAPDNPNPRLDKLYPFDKFGYELINNRCFYYKSLAFKLMQDANIINTLYPMVIDGTYLNMFPPLVHIGSESIGSDVMVPGTTVNLTDYQAKLQSLRENANMADGLNAMMKVEQSLDESSQRPEQAGQKTPVGSMTAYEMSRLEQNASTVLGLFVQMIAQHVKDFGTLRLGDILQYLTIADASKIEGKGELVYRTFVRHDKVAHGKVKTRHIQFDGNLPDEAMTPETHLAESFKVLEEEGGLDSTKELYKVNPTLFRDLTYECFVSPDIMNPRSQDLERAYDLDLYDKMLANPLADPEETLRLLLSTDPKTRKDPDRYIRKQTPQGPQMPMGGMPPGAGMPGGRPVPPAQRSPGIGMLSTPPTAPGVL